MNQNSCLESTRVFSFFRKICAIPHGSGHTEALSRYCIEIAQAHGLWYRQDEIGNVLIQRPASPGFENAPAVVLQAHLDMVCVRTASPENAEELPVRIHQDGDMLMAEDSTLGADNGIGIAYILALLTQGGGEYPMLEALLTVDEETTMAGANAFDVSWLQGRRMINLDSEEEGYLLAGSAGGIALDCSAPPQIIQRSFHTGMYVELQLSGLEGGHSGLDIHKGRGNAIRALAELLLQADGELDYLLCSLSGGRFSNAIPDEAHCQLVMEYENLPHLSALVGCWEANLCQNLNRPEIRLSFSVHTQESPQVNGFSNEFAHRWLSFVTQVPNGLQRMDDHVPHMVSLSTNLGILHLDDQICQACFALRSNVESEKENLLHQMVLMAKDFQFATSAHDEYPCWEYRKNSLLRDCAYQVYAKITGHPPVVTTIHAGAECGIFCGKLPDLDCISIGPDIWDAHTINERTSLSSVGRVWQFLQALLKELGCC